MYMIERNVENSLSSRVEIVEAHAVHIPRPNPDRCVRYVADIVVDYADVSFSREKDAKRLLKEHFS